MQVDPVTWSDELAEEAKSWADYLAENNKFEHAPNLQAGENLYRSGKPPPTEPCTEATKLESLKIMISTNLDFQGTQATSPR